MLRKQKYTCFIYGEGQNDKQFLIRLIDLEKFKYHTKKWQFKYGNAHGQSPKEILTKCRREVAGRLFNLIECFIDLDVLKRNYPKHWEKRWRNLKIIFPK